MRPRAALCHGLLGAVWFVATIFATDAHAGTDETEETEETVEYEFSGRLSAESRWFPEAGAFSGQRSLASGFVAAPRFYLEDADGRNLTLAPFFRYDHSDPRRTPSCPNINELKTRLGCNKQVQMAKQPGGHKWPARWPPHGRCP